MRALTLPLWLVLAGAAAAGENTVPRYIEFRDGTVLRLPVVDENRRVMLIRAGAAVEEKTVRLSAFTSLTLTPAAGLEKKRAFLNAVRKLGSDDFHEREAGQAEVGKLGPAARGDLVLCLGFFRDVEVLARARRILGEWPAPTGEPATLFDVMHLSETRWGHLDDKGIPALYQGKVHRLQRQDVRTLSAERPFSLAGLGRDKQRAFARIRPADFPLNCVEEPFEQAPDRRPLQIGENIEKLFVARGFVLSTSITSSHVSVNNHTVTGKSRGLSVATHRPIWEGEVTIRFVQPGKEHVPAGVTHFACYIAAVVPGGTALVAEDFDGRELGRIQTEANGTDFLGVRSSTPIHRIRIVPNPQIDRDYTLDDFIFSPPQTVEAAHPDKYTVYLEEGKVHCRDVAFTAEGLRLLGLPGRLADMPLARDQLIRVNAPEVTAKHSPPGVFVELRDGSVLYGALAADQHGVPTFARRPGVLSEREQIAGIWGAAQRRQLPPAKMSRPALWDETTRQWQPVAEVAFHKDQVTWKRGQQSEGADYAKLPPLWLAHPSDVARAGCWHIRTVLGEELVLDAMAPLAGRAADQIEGSWQGRPLRLQAAEIRAIFQVVD